MASKPPPSVVATAARPSTARRQPLRQARTARKPAANKVLNGTEPSAQHVPPAKFYPALTAFTDAVDALPSEIIRHLTLLREVDAKACFPEANLRTLIDAAERLPAAKEPYEFDAAMEALNRLDELRRRRNTDPLFAANLAQTALLAEMEKHEAAEASTAASQSILSAPESRRARCHQIRSQITDLSVTQDEKNAVIATAVEALQKHLARVEHAFAYVEVEIPQIYRLGNQEHWAYKEPMKKGTAAQIAREKERERREQEERLHQLQMERESNVRGGSRGNTAKNSHHHYAHHQHQEEHEPTKKRVRKTGDNETLSSTKRIADQQAGAQQQQQQPKKRKTAGNKDERDKAANVKGTASPRAGTPVLKKAKNTAQRAPRSRTAQTPNASATNSPLLAPPNIPFPHVQPISATLNVASPLNPATPFTVATPTSLPTATPSLPLPPQQARKPFARKEPVNPPIETEDTDMLLAQVQEPPPPPPPKVSHKKKPYAPSPSESAVEEQVPKKNTPALPPKKEKEKEDHHPPAINTKAKPSGSGGEPKSAASTTGTPGGNRNRKRADSNATLASVSSVAGATEPTKKKSHKAKSQQKSSAAPIGLGISTASVTGAKEKGQGESGDEDESEERYCYCDSVSYGEMVACDGEDCAKEWFHLECVGLTQAPKGKVKWYCRNCEAIRGRGRSRA